jgi:hypothetical protein
MNVAPAWLQYLPVFEDPVIRIVPGVSSPFARPPRV